MTVGMAAASANSALDTWLGTVYVKWHVGDPGAAGTANPAGVTTRSQATFSSASAGSKALSNTPSYTATGGETLTHISLWTASTAGTFLGSASITSRAVVSGDVYNLTSLTGSITPLAA